MNSWRKLLIELLSSGLKRWLAPTIWRTEQRYQRQSWSRETTSSSQLAVRSHIARVITAGKWFPRETDIPKHCLFADNLDPSPRLVPQLNVRCSAEETDEKGSEERRRIDFAALGQTGQRTADSGVCGRSSGERRIPLCFSVPFKAARCRV